MSGAGVVEEVHQGGGDADQEGTSEGGEDADFADGAGPVEAEPGADDQDQSGQQQPYQAGDDGVETDGVDQVADRGGAGRVAGAGCQVGAVHDILRRFG